MRDAFKLTSLALLCALLLPALAHAQDAHRLALQAVWSNPSGDLSFRPDPASRLDVEAQDDFGIQVSWEVLLGERLGVATTVTNVDYDVDAEARVQGMSSGRRSIGSLEVSPLMVTARYHFWAGPRARFHVGGGLAYVLYGDLELASESLDVDDDLTYALEAGVRVPFGSRWSLAGDVRYIDTEAELDELGEPLDVSPFDVAVGVELRL